VRGFAAELSRCGYVRTSVQLQLHLVAHLSRWLVGEGLEETGLNRQAIDRFLTHRQEAGYTNYLSCKALDPLLGYLRDLGALAPASPNTPETDTEILLERYGRYLRAERGLAASSTRAYVDMARLFLNWRATTDELDLEHLNSGDVTAFVLAECPRRSSGSAKLVVSALRSLLGFLHVDGIIAESLRAAVPSVASYRLAELPKALERDQVRRLLTTAIYAKADREALRILAQRWPGGGA